MRPRGPPGSHTINEQASCCSSLHEQLNNGRLWAPSYCERVPDHRHRRQWLKAHPHPDPYPHLHPCVILIHTSLNPKWLLLLQQSLGTRARLECPSQMSQLLWPYALTVTCGATLSMFIFWHATFPKNGWFFFFLNTTQLFREEFGTHFAEWLIPKCTHPENI